MKYAKIETELKTLTTTFWVTKDKKKKTLEKQEKKQKIDTEK